jgi:hypothetical protein
MLGGTEGPVQSTPSRRTGIRIRWAAAALLALVSIVCQWRIGFNNDNAWLIYAASRVLDGAHLYVDLVEINPPLIVWMNLPVVWVARVAALDPISVFRAFVLVTALGSAALCQALSGAFRPLPSGAVFLLCVLVLLVLPVTWFGQREHLLLVLTLPYLLLSARRLAGAPRPPTVAVAVMIGVMAGIGLALKPHFLGVWVFVMGLELGKSHSLVRGPENLAVAAVGAAYIGAVLLFTPEYLALASALWSVYSDYRASDLLTILFGRFEALVPILALSIYSVYRKRVEPRVLTDLLAVSTAGALIGLALQGKGFDYHYYPALGLSVLLVGVVSLSVPTVRAVSAPRARALAGALLIIASAVYLEAGLRIGFGPEHSEMAAYRALERAVGPVAGRSLLVLAPRSGYAFGLVTYAGARWTSRFPCMWVPPALYPSGTDHRSGPTYRAPEEMTPVERWFRSSVVADAVGTQPELILVGVPTPGLGPPDYWFDLLKYFTQDAEFARLMTNYERVGESVGYVVYRRKGYAPHA